MPRKVDLPDYAWNEEGAKRYARESEKSDMQFRVFFDKLAAISAGDRILDVGAGPGPLTARIAERYATAEVTALEISPIMAQLGKEYIEGKGLSGRVRYITGDAADNTVLDSLGRYDLICSNFSLHEWDNPRELILRLRRLLTSNLTRLLHDLRRVPWLSWIPLRMPMLQAVRASYTVEEIRELLYGIPQSQVNVSKDPPFLLTVTIRALED